jgi:hypothetical protein
VRGPRTVNRIRRSRPPKDRTRRRVIGCPLVVVRGKGSQHIGLLLPYGLEAQYGSDVIQEPMNAVHFTEVKCAQAF